MCDKPVSPRALSRVLFTSLLVAQIVVAIPIAAAHGVVLSAGIYTGGADWADAAFQFDGVGAIECGGAATSSIRESATAWVVGSTDTIVTAAHVFFGPKSSRRADSITSPDRCVFILYDHQNRVRDIVGIRYGLSRWTDRLLRDDISHDVAVLKLERQTKVTSLPAAKVSRALFKPLIALIAFHGEMGGERRARATSGRLFLFPSNQLLSQPGQARVTKPGRLFATSADSTPGSSGGMYYDPQEKVALGLHLGWLCDEGTARYPPACINYGIRFDRTILAMIASAMRDEPNPDFVIDGNETGARTDVAAGGARQIPGYYRSPETRIP